MKRGLLLLMALVPGTAFAQSPLPEWAAKVKFGRPVFVTTASGERIDGTAGQITPDSLIVSTAGGLRTVPMMLPVSWALMGWGVDALIKRRSTVFDVKRGATVSLGFDRRAFRATIRF